MPEVTADQLWDDFSYYQSRTGHFQKRQKKNSYIKPLKTTPERVALMEQMRQWCKERDLPPRQWLYSLFGIRRWMFAPQLKTGHLCSENHRDKFTTFSDYGLFAERMRSLESQEQVTKPNTFDPNRDISHSAEEAKREYTESGREEICMFQMKIETFGFHPLSDICKQCNQQTVCAQKLQDSVSFDIGALRRGEITAEEAYKTALSSVGGYGN